MNECAKLWKLWLADRTIEKWTNFRNQRKNTTKIIRRVKKNQYKEILEGINSDFKQHNTRDYYRIFKDQLRGYQPSGLCFRDENGKLALDNKQNCQILARYFEKLLNCDEPK
ncbi:uncharacterized protein LOC142321269 [Lycorma delicatula]|uniref:uncharacterized protein LOC142321269 n=1 Tax=Lycorma delicatula TaxID=130591 RepID=UPI003F514BA4